MPHVSIIIPVYNSQSFIAQALESIRVQTFHDWEVLLIDDGSTDGTLAAAQSTGVPFRHFIQPHKGPGAARNRGVRESQGQWIAFLDADDSWLPNKLQLQLEKTAQDSSVGGVYTDAWLIENGRRLERKSDQVIFPSGDIAEAVLLDPRIICTSTLLVRRDIWDQIGPFDEGSPISEDWEWFVRLACRTRLEVVHEPVVHYRLHDGNTHRNIDVNFPHAVRMLEKAVSEYSRGGRALSPHRQRQLWHTFYQTYGIAYLFSWRSLRALPFFLKAVRYQPGNVRSYGYALASLLPGGWLRGLQSWRGRTVNEASGDARGISDHQSQTGPGQTPPRDRPVTAHQREKASHRSNSRR
jgi:glycosyltransferase involved in cell wall biosynthesis